jgi:hypothetical protein
MNSKHIEAVLRLPGPRRYEHFIKVVADRGKAWGLYENGWALAANSEEAQVFPLWPAPEFAELVAIGEWSKYKPREIGIEDLLDRLLPSLRETGTLVGVFPTPSDKGVLPEIDVFENDLRNELSKFGGPIEF